MSCTQLDNALPRISARRGQVVDLNVDFFDGGVLSDPYAIRHVEIYKTQVLPHNLVSVIPIADIDDDLYPLPLCRDYVDDTVSTAGSSIITGRYHLPYQIPSDAPVPDVYFDVWSFYPTNPCDGTCDLSDAETELSLVKCCHRFWVYPENWFCDDRLQTIRFGFEPLDQRFQQPEVRPLEVGLMPLPLYDFNFNLVSPMVPFLIPTISITTQRCELLIDNDPCRIGIRQGSFRTNPFVIQYDLDTNLFLKGTYQYFITLQLPNGSTRVSRKFILVIA